MKAFISSSIIALLATAAVAAPAAPAERDVPYASISLTNDMSGANAAEQIPIGAGPVKIATLWAGTSVAQAGGSIIASSTSLVGGYAANPVCTFTNAAGAQVARLTTTKTFVKFGSDPNMLQTVDLRDVTITCSN